MQVIEVNRTSGSVTFAEGDMEFVMYDGRVVSHLNRKPNPREYKKALKQFFSITK